MEAVNNKLFFSDQPHSLSQDQASPIKKDLFSQRRKRQQNASWLPTTKTALIAAGVLATIGTGYLAYQRYTIPKPISLLTSPVVVQPSTLNLTDVVFAIIATIVIFRFCPSEIGKKSSCKEIAVNKFVEPIPTDELSKIIETLKDDESTANCDRIIEKLNKVPLPLTDDQKTVVQSFATFIDNKLNTSKDEVFEDSNFLKMLDNAFVTLLKLDEQAALEIAKKCITNQYDETYLNHGEGKITPKQECFRGIVLEALMDREIGLKLAIDCLEKIKTSKNKLDIYNYRNLIESAIVNYYNIDNSFLIKFIEGFGNVYEDKKDLWLVRKPISQGLNQITKKADKLNELFGEVTKDEQIKAKKTLIQVAEVLIIAKQHSFAEILINDFDEEMLEHVYPTLEKNSPEILEKLKRRDEAYEKHGLKKKLKPVQDGILPKCILF